jgi:hypothetical protein
VRKIYAIILFWVFACNSQAQNYGNAWINYNQQYFKFPISKEGVYRIDSLTLSSFYDLSLINPKHFQLMFKGQEQFIFIKGEEDDKINTNDYLEFYLNPTGGEMDSTIYSNIKYLPNPYAPIFNDTIYAFLSINNFSLNKRYVEENDTNFNAYTAQPYFYTEKINAFNNTYNYVEEYTYDVSDPHYTQAEGKGAGFSMGATLSSAFSPLNIYTISALPARLDLNFSGASISNLIGIDHEIKINYLDQNSNVVLLYDSLFRGYTPVKKSFVLNAQNIGNNSSFNISSVNAPQFSAISGFSNYSILHFMRFYYPHTANFSNEKFFKLYIENSSLAQKSYFNFSGFNAGINDPAVVYDISNGKKIVATTGLNQVKMLVPNSAGVKTCILLAESEIKAITALTKVAQNGTFTNFKNLAGDKPYVIVYHKKLESSANDYKNYRESSAGGGYKVIAANISELYEQFAQGINKHPIAIKNFVKFLNDSLGAKPQYVLLLGKGVEQNQLENSSQFLNLVPTMGYPASDILLTSALSSSLNNNFFPDIPVGRIAATTNSQVTNYLLKVQQHESTGSEEWKKRVLHFVGGDTPALSAQLEAYMDTYKETIKDTLFGAEVFTYKKNTTAPIQTSISDSIKNVINGGAALINFFGHGSQEGFDQAIDDPESYNNTAKYPFIIANSCYSGNIHLKDVISVSEKFIFTSQKGSIGFLATTAYGFPYALNNYTGLFYRSLARTSYNKGIGDIIKEAAMSNSASPDYITQFTGLDMTLHGDPALRISTGALPDYQLKNSDVIFDLNTYADSLGICIKMKNLGKAINDSMRVNIVRVFANADELTVLKKIKAPLFKDSLKSFMPLDFDRGIGLNKFTVKLDQFEEIQESSETNNGTIGTVDFFVPGGDIIPVYPYKYAIVPKTNSLVLKASTTDPFAPSAAYRFQLDTCDRFLNPIQSTLINSSGGVLTWQVNLPFADSTVYFWRVSRDSLSPTKGFAWRESSFQTIGEKEGWAQAHFNQFKNNGYQFVNYRRDQRRFVFQNTTHSVKGRTGIFPFLSLEKFNYYFDGLQKEGWPSGFNGWNIAVFDSISGQPQETRSMTFPATGFGPFNNCCEHNYPRYVYTFGATTACGNLPGWKTDLQNFLNGIPTNQYVLAYTTGFQAPVYSGLSTYNNALYTAFESIGAKNIRTTPDSVAYIMFGKKGMSAGQAQVKIGANKKEIVILEDSITTRWNNGFIASEIIGPASKWNSLHWRTKSVDVGAGDTSVLKIVGIKTNGQIDTLVRFPTDSADVFSLSNYINAAVYPQIKLVAFMRDNVFNTATQLKRWQVIYDHVPECAINPLKGFSSINDTLQEGDDVVFRFPIENIGRETFKDSLAISYWIEDNNRNKIPLPDRLKTKGFAPGAVLIDTVKINSYQLLGNNSLWIYVNPLQNTKYQNEQFSFNNIGRYAFKVNKDLANPLLDVTFDGVRILNGDIVSAKPNILISLKDENKFLALNDTSAFTLALKSPDQNTSQRIFFARALQFTPANLPKNSCSILYNPVLTTDGKYALTVEAKDRSRNASGAQDYRIEFEINNKPTVTSILNYPNPFSSSTKFVFTLTGSEIPEVFTIRIMTITGKIVREITKAELGNLRIGRNITDYAWDGRDDFGDRLANGVYLYHVITKLNGASIEKSNTGADKYFVKEVGKMVLMR